MTSIQELRKYRLNIEELPFLNDKDNGIALFDLLSTFFVAYILDLLFNLSSKIPICDKNKKYVYYLSLIPIGIIIHHLVAHYQSTTLFPEEMTFLNKKIFSLDLNIYKILLIALLYGIYDLC